LNSSFQFSDKQISQLEEIFQNCADNASDAMVRWLGSSSLMTIESIDQAPLEDVQVMLGAADEPICCCSINMTGSLNGWLILAFRDTSGLALSDLVLNNPLGTAIRWHELEQSVALESTNIIGCAFLNSLAKHLPPLKGQPSELIPSPPLFARDYAGCLLESVFMKQAQTANELFVSESRIELGGESLNWNLLFVPDSNAIVSLQELLTSLA